MSAVTWTNEKSAAAKRRSLARRLAYGPALVLGLCAGSSGMLIVAMLLYSVFEI